MAKPQLSHVARSPQLLKIMCNLVAALYVAGPALSSIQYSVLSCKIGVPNASLVRHIDFSRSHRSAYADRVGSGYASEGTDVYSSGCCRAKLDGFLCWRFGWWSLG